MEEKRSTRCFSRSAMSEMPTNRGKRMVNAGGFPGAFSCWPLGRSQNRLAAMRLSQRGRNGAHVCRAGWDLGQRRQNGLKPVRLSQKE
ncbi:hypothetical protein HDF10_003889 [Edaphobacter lichenicola]|uniref:Uncharacterized protein n=1 Tax=Tunturiibacter lichenicola TaxID=2051959 RepID=A0A7W8N5S4_9BACT|nr:hypothetical protein [Edaphobacter lichenicola]